MPALFQGFKGFQGLSGQGVLSQGQMPPAQVDPSFDPSWYRADGSRKGRGFLGPLPTHDGRTATEISIGVGVDGKQMEIPSLVPTLSQEEIKHLLGGGAPTDAIVGKAIDHARMRMRQGLPVFSE